MKTSLFTQCLAAVGGHHRNGAFLYRLMFWYSRTKIVLNGKKWVIKSHAEWRHDVQMSETQLNDTIRDLRAINFIESTTRRFGTVNKTMYRVTETGQKAISEYWSNDKFTPHPDLPNDKSLSELPNDSVGSNICGSYMSGINMSGTCESSSTSSPEEENFEEGDIEKEGSEVVKLSAKQTVADVLASAKGKVPTTIHEIWVQAKAERTKKFVPPLTTIEKSQLKTFAKHCPDGIDAGERIKLVIANWGSFVEEVNKAKNQKSGPDEPLVAYLFKHRDVAINFTSKDDQAKPTSKMKIIGPS